MIDIIGLAYAVHQIQQIADGSDDVLERRFGDYLKLKIHRKRNVTAVGGGNIADVFNY